MAPTDIKDTKDRLLDAAEALFGERGVAAVSVREITSVAGANIAAVNYHFRSKDGLLLGVLNRRMEPLNNERLELLDRVEVDAGEDPPEIEKVLAAFVGPTFRMSRRHPEFMKFLGQLHHEGGSFAHKLLATGRFPELIDRMRSSLLCALPGSEPSEMWWGMSFVMGAMIHTWMKGHEVEAISSGEAVYGSDEAMIERLTNFAAAGFRAIPGSGGGGEMRIWSLLLIALLLPGCMSLAEPEVPEVPIEVPAEFGPQDETAVEAPEAAYEVPEDWWIEFGDPRIDELVREAILANPTLAEAEARLRAALALSEIAGAELDPWLSGGMTLGRESRFTGTNPLFPPTTTNSAFGASLNLSWEADVWGRIRSGQAAAVADVEVQNALLRGAYLSLAVQTAKACLAATEAGQQAEVARQNLASAERLHVRIRERYEMGLRQILDVKLAQTEVASAKAQVFLWERAQDAALRQLENLLGRYASGKVAVSAELPDLPEAFEAGIPADVVARRPDLVAAERAYVSAFYREEEARASLYPRIALTASGGLASSDLSDLAMGDFAIWSLGANLLAPLYQGGRLRANIDLNTATKEQAGAVFATYVLRAFTEVETSLAAEGFLGDREDALSELVDEALATAVLSEDRFLAGLADILTVLEARRRYFSSKAQLLRVQLERLTNRIDFYASLGGGVPVAPDAN